MKRIIFSLLALLVVLGGFSQSSRKIVSLKDVDWKVLVGMQSLDLNTQQNINLDSTVHFIGEFDIDEPCQMVALYHYGSDVAFDFSVGETVLANEIDGANFYADLSANVGQGKNRIVLKPQTSITVNQFKTAIKSTQICLLGGMVFTKFQFKVDSYFGGKLLEVKIHNFNDKDLDGKIYAKLYNVENTEQLAGNNNCAFSRSGLECTIEIVFPELKTDLSGKKVMVELTIVDKENNEEIVDQLTLPVSY